MHPANRTWGFTLVELMVTIAVAMVLLVLGLPSLRTMLQNNRVSSQANELFTSLNMARSEAIKQQRNVYLTALNATSSNELGAGWNIWVDGPNGTAGTQHSSEPTLEQTDALQNGATVDVTPNASQIFFRPDGTASTAVTLALREPDCRGSDSARNISVSVVGRVSVSKVACP
jgi:type IV fimbrial biogenesis protein FimT